MIKKFEFLGQQLTKSETESLLKAVFKEQQERVPLINSALKDFGSEMLLKRIEIYNLNFMFTDLFYAISRITWCDSPGKLMGLLWLTFCFCKDRNGNGNQKYDMIFNERKCNLLGIAEWCEIFQNGVPTDKEFEKWWDSQKGEKVDNLVDIKEEWK